MGKYLDFWNSFLTVVGLSCLQKNRDADDDEKYQVSYWKYPIPLTILLIIILNGFYLGVQISEETGIVSGYSNLVGNVVACLIIICSTINSKAYAKIKHRFTNYDEILTIDYKNLAQSIFIYVAAFSLLYIFAFITDFIDYRDGPTDAAAIRLISVYIFQFYNFLNIVHFSVCLFWLRKCFSLINNDFESHVRSLGDEAWKDKSKLDVRKLFMNYIEDSSNLLRVRAPEMIKESSPVERLRFLRALYHGAFILSKEVNDIFGTRNIVTVGYNFAMGTVSTYSGIIALVQLANGAEVSPLLLLIHFKWTLISFLSIYGLVWPCTATVDEAKKTWTIVQGIMTRTNNEEVIGELQSAVFQFLHEQISFSPHGFFHLNNNLLLSILGAVVSYLVVLIQFKISMT